MPTTDRADAVRAVLDDVRVAVSIGVVDVEAVGLGVVRVERHREQPLLAAAQDDRADVEERRAPRLAGLEHDDPAGLLDDVQASRLTRGRGRVHRRLEVGDPDDPEGVTSCRRRARGDDNGQDRDRDVSQDLTPGVVWQSCRTAAYSSGGAAL